ncbi:hypothetical protein [Marinitenerispora sediminis]|uniref:hypothetical protein n=1 Tax=Marinitenerispora sediminis TaxID=1931232 RepID=UPI002867EFC0|nr:hypothetical protein [Marinitenerispora sediminis]
MALVALGIYLSVAGLRGEEEPEQQQGQASGDTAGSDEAQQPEPAAPSPIPTTDAADMSVMDWFPFSEEDFQAAATVAQRFGAAYGTIDYTQSPEAYYDSLAAFTTADYARTVEQSSGAGALWGEMAEQEAVAAGRANVESVRHFDDESIVFVVRTQSIVEGGDSAASDLGDFAVTMVRERGEWRVFDFQPAEAGNLGDGG